MRELASARLLLRSVVAAGQDGGQADADVLAEVEDVLAEIVAAAAAKTMAEGGREGSGAAVCE